MVADVGVPLGGGHVGVTEQLLHGAEVRAAVEQVGREGVPQRVRVGGPRRTAVQDAAHVAGRQAPAPLVAEQRGTGLRRHHLVAHGQPGAECGGRRGAEGHAALLGALAPHRHRPPAICRIHVQTAQFTHATPLPQSVPAPSSRARQCGSSSGWARPARGRRGPAPAAVIAHGDRRPMAGRPPPHPPGGSRRSIGAAPRPCEPPCVAGRSGWRRRRWTASRCTGAAGDDPPPQVSTPRSAATRRSAPDPTVGRDRVGRTMGERRDERLQTPLRGHHRRRRSGRARGARERAWAGIAAQGIRSGSPEREPALEPPIGPPIHPACSSRASDIAAPTNDRPDAGQHRRRARFVPQHVVHGTIAARGRASVPLPERSAPVPAPGRPAHHRRPARVALRHAATSWCRRRRGWWAGRAPPSPGSNGPAPRPQ